jgi:hypothetical protein
MRLLREGRGTLEQQLAVEGLGRPILRPRAGGRTSGEAAQDQ